MIFVQVADAELSNCTQLTRHPGSQNLSTLLFTKSRAREVPVGDEGNNICDDLVFAQDCVDNDRNKRGQERLASDLDDHHDQAACLEDGTVDKLVSKCVTKA
jgi:hypothetical protein